MSSLSSVSSLGGVCTLCGPGKRRITAHWPEFSSVSPSVLHSRSEEELVEFPTITKCPTGIRHDNCSTGAADLRG